MRRGLLALLALLCVSGLAPGGALGAVAKDPIAAGHQFTGPTFLAQPPGETERLFVTEKAGLIRLVDGSSATTFLDITDRVSNNAGERGLLSIAFDPDYASSGLFYVYFTNKAGDIRVTEFRVSENDPDVADPESGRAVLRIRHRAHANHNGGQLQFGPDGYLWVGTGDGGGAGDPGNNALDRNSEKGKLLRIDPQPSPGKTYTVPPDNPYAGPKPGKGTVWAKGLRNPWRFSFDDDDLVLADVGQDRFEEIDYAEGPNPARKANFGWSGWEGFARFNPNRGPFKAANHTKPISRYCHFGNVSKCGSKPPGCSITGGYVVRDPALTDLFGRYVYADFCGDWVRSLDPSGGGSGDADLGITVDAPSSFGEDNAGRIYVLSLSQADGRIYRLEQAP